MTIHHSKRNKAYVLSYSIDDTYSCGGVSVIDMASNSEIGVIPLPQGMYGWSLVFDSLSNQLYVGASGYDPVTWSSQNAVYIIDCNTYQISPSNIVPMGLPVWMTRDPKTNTLYIGNQNWPDSIDVISGTGQFINHLVINNGVTGVAVLNLN